MSVPRLDPLSDRHYGRSSIVNPARPAAKQSPRSVATQPRSIDVGFVASLVVVCLVGFVLTAYYAMKFGIPVVDTLNYLEVGRNLLQGRGFVTRFNFLHAWSGRSDYPGMAYYNPLYGLVLGTLWQLLDPRAVGVLATAVPCCLNAALIALIVRRSIGSVPAILSAIGFLLLPTTWDNLTMITAEQPAMTVVLLCLMLIQRCAPGSRRCWLCVGAIFGLGYFVKVGIATAVPGVIAAVVLTQAGSLAQRLRASRQPVLLLMAGIGMVVLPYTLLCKFTVGEIYPVYARAYRPFTLALQIGGHYVADSPAIRPDPARLPGLRDRAMNVLVNQWRMLRQLAGELGLLSGALIIGVAAARGAVRRQVILLLSVGASMAMGHAAALNWDRMDPGWAARYAIYTAPLLYPVGVYGIEWLVGRLLTGAVTRRAVVVAIWFLVSLPIVVPRFQSLRMVFFATEPRMLLMQHAMKFYAALIGPDDLVALDSSTFTACAAAFLDRPIVSLPFRKMDTPQSLHEFIEVFHPTLVIPGTTRSSFEVLPGLGYEQKQIPELGNAIVFLRRPGDGS